MILGFLNVTSVLHLLKMSHCKQLKIILLTLFKIHNIVERELIKIGGIYLISKLFNIMLGVMKRLETFLLNLQNRGKITFKYFCIFAFLKIHLFQLKTFI